MPNFKRIIATPVYENEMTYIQDIADAMVRKNKKRIDALQDVVETASAANNMTLVYESDSDTYVRKHIDVDGGYFGNPPYLQK